MTSNYWNDDDDDDIIDDDNEEMTNDDDMCGIMKNWRNDEAWRNDEVVWLLKWWRWWRRQWSDEPVMKVIDEWW